MHYNTTYVCLTKPTFLQRIVLTVHVIGCLTILTAVARPVVECGYCLRHSNRSHEWANIRALELCVMLGEHVVA